MRRFAPAAAVTAAVLVAFVLVLTAGGGDNGAPTGAPCSGSGSGAGTATAVAASAPVRTVVRKPPSPPGHEAWTGAWTMPDGSLMVAFTEVEGPASINDRTPAPESLKVRLGTDELPENRDFLGLRSSIRYLRSTDGGKTFSTVHVDDFKALYPNAYAASGTIGLKDGSILRRVNGWDLQQDPSVPHTAFLQELKPGAKDWTKPRVLLPADRFTYQLSRIRRLGDGCLIALGQRWALPAGRPYAELRKAPVSLLMLVSADDGATWRSNPVTPPPGGGYLGPNEWDAAELRNGDLLAVFRTLTAPGAKEQKLREGLLERRGNGWQLTNLRDAPMPVTGHPELLATRQGPILSIATSGVEMTADSGRTWSPLRFKDGADYHSDYYPSSVETKDGVVHVFSHNGVDSGYGSVPDQMIVEDTFALSKGAS